MEGSRTNRGHEAARQACAQATLGTTDLQVLKLAWQFSYRVGELDHAQKLVERWLSISGRDAESPDSAAREYGTNPRDLFQKTGMPHMVKKLNDWLDDLPSDPPPPLFPRSLSPPSLCPFVPASLRPFFHPSVPESPRFR